MPIVQVSGTYGSGKTHVIRSFMAGRRVKNIGRRVNGFFSGHLVDDRYFVVGDYVTSEILAGIDALDDMAFAFALVRHHHRAGHGVVIETLMDENELPAMHAESGGAARVLCLTTPLALCIEAVRQRRRYMGDEALAYVEKTAAHHRTMADFLSVMARTGIPVSLASREDAPRALNELLQIR